MTLPTLVASLLVAQASAGTPSTAPPAAGGGQRADATAAALASLQAEVDAMHEELRETQQALDDERARNDALEERLAAREDAAEAAARSPAIRADALGSAAGGLDGALRQLSAGDANGVDGALADVARSLSDARAEAGGHGATAEASNARTGAELVQAARDALANGDLYRARWYLGSAAALAAGAQQLATEAAGGTGGAPTSGTGAGTPRY
jgi:hypothetical protein